MFSLKSIIRVRSLVKEGDAAEGAPEGTTQRLRVAQHGKTTIRSVAAGGWLGRSMIVLACSNDCVIFHLSRPSRPPTVKTMRWFHEAAQSIVCMCLNPDGADILLMGTAGGSIYLLPVLEHMEGSAGASRGGSMDSGRDPTLVRYVPCQLPLAAGRQPRLLPWRAVCVAQLLAAEVCVGRDGHAVAAGWPRRG